MTTKSKSYYDLLDIPKTANQSDIKKAYRKKALEHHPDKGGDEEKFKEINKVYHVLSDPEKKQKYDQFGEGGVEMDNSFNPNDIFQSMFNNSGFQHMFNGNMNFHQARQARQPPKRDVNMIYNLDLSLEELYVGIKKQLRIHTDRLCNTCRGTGCKGEVPTCDGCHGSGKQTIIRQIGSMVLQQTSICHRCNGKGNFITDEIKCQECKGHCVTKKSNIYNIHVVPGTTHGQQIILKNAGNQYPDVPIGDVIISIAQQKHSLFERRGHDLFCNHTINIQDAICGFKFNIKQLNNEIYYFKSIFITEHETEKIIPCKGMPILNKTKFGNLIIKFHINFDKLDDLTCLDKLELSNVFDKIYTKNNTDNIDDDKYIVF
jgi:DnaJ family protein A protein 2